MSHPDHVFANFVNSPSSSITDRKRGKTDGFSWAVILTVLCMAAFVMTCCVAAFGQTASSTEGTIVGTVMDASGAAIPGATVTLSGAKVMGPTSVVSGGAGEYHFPTLQPGEYSVSATKEGFAVGQVKAIQVGLGFTATVNVTLQTGSIEQTVTVDATGAAIDTESTNVTTRLSTQTLEELPGSRDFWAVIAQAPAISLGRVDVGGSNALTQQSSVTYGLTSGSGVNRGMVEGVMVNEGAGGSSEMYYTDYGALAEMAVNAAGNTAEMPNPGVLTQLVVKSGGNKYHGNIYYDYENDTLEGADIDSNLIKLGLTGSNVLSVYDTNRIAKFSDFNADLGGFIKKDKLWWYGAFRYTSVGQRYPTLLDDTQVTTSPVFTGKMNYDINSKQKIIGFYQHSAKVQPDYLGAIYIGGGRASPALMTASSVWHSTFPTYVWKVEYDYIISPNILLETRVGQYHSDWTRTGKSDAPRIEDTLDNYVSGGVYATENNRSRPQFSGSLTFNKTGWLGSHSFKFGGEYMRDTITEPQGQFASACNCVSVFNNKVPTYVYFYTPTTSKNGNSTTGLYGTDTWAITKRLNVNIGVRWDDQNIFLPAQTGANNQQFAAVSSAIRFNNVAPRIGFDYDLFGNHKTIVKSSFGQFYIYPGSDYASAFNQNPAGWTEQYKWSAATAGCSGNTPTCFWNSNGTTARPHRFLADGVTPNPDFVASTGGSNSIVVNPSLKNTYSLQGTMFLERELASSFTVRSGFVWNGRRDVAASIDPTRPLSAYGRTLTIKDPGPDGVLNTADDGQSYTAYDLNAGLPTSSTVTERTNVHESSNYYNFEVSATRHSTGRWSLLASYAYTWAYETSLGAGYNPNAEINAPGGVNAYTNWEAKFNATYRTKWDIHLTPILRVQSGTPFGRTFSQKFSYGSTTILAEPYNTERTPTVAPLDTRVEKEFRIHERFHLTAIGDVYNIFNTNAIQATTVTSGSAWMRPVAVTGPRVGRFGFKFQF